MNNSEMESSNSIKTYTGKLVDVFNPRSGMFCIEDIAHQLSLMPRWMGSSNDHYSVAHHSVWCALRAIERGFSHKVILTALMHDASEAYIGDMPTPFKKRMPEYTAVESHLMAFLAFEFGFKYPMPEEVKEIDREALNEEWNQMFNGSSYNHPYVTVDVESDFIELYNIHRLKK